MVDIKDYFYNKNRDDIYHPFSDYNEDKYFPFPEKSLTEQLVLIRQIWDDILCLSEIYKEQEDPHKRKAILKYMIMDMCSLYDKFQEFKDLIIHDSSIKYEQQKEILKKFDSFLLKFKSFSKGTRTIPSGKYRSVRNKLSAHRDRGISLSEVKSMWDNLISKDIKDVLEEFRHFYGYFRNLNIYQWVQYNKNGRVRMSIPLRWEKKNDE